MEHNHCNAQVGWHIAGDAGLPLLNAVSVLVSVLSVPNNTRGHRPEYLGPFPGVPNC